MNNSSKNQTRIIIGVALVVLSAVFFYIAFSQPKVSVVSQNSVAYSSVSSQNNADTATVADTNNQTDDSDKSEATTTSVSNQDAESYKVNINTATVEQLTAVEGIGQGRAEAIVEYRQSVGKFNSVDEIKNIKGIGDSTYARVAQYLTV